jgi:hypothetical protein
MENAVIYLRQNEKESIDDFIKSIENSRNILKSRYEIIAIIGDFYNDRSQLFNFINSPSDNIDVVIFDSIIDDFDQRLLSEIARIENFRIDFFDRRSL